jgi:hypothetical protein
LTGFGTHDFILHKTIQIWSKLNYLHKKFQPQYYLLNYKKPPPATPIKIKYLKSSRALLPAYTHSYPPTNPRGS